MQFGDFSRYEFLANLMYRNYNTITEESDGFEIYSPINKRINNKRNSYVTVIKNGLSGKCYNGPRPDQKTCRISIFKPEYLQYDEMLTKGEKQWFIDYMTNNWNYVLDYNYEMYHDWFRNYNYKRISSPCPDYSLLPTLD